MSSIIAIKLEADLCVACGLCLPVCPTYRKLRVESESPRGRIALIQGVITGGLDLTPKLISHLDLCLACRACENVCPSRVAYGKLIDSTRSLIRTRSLSYGARKPVHKFVSQLFYRLLVQRWLGKSLRLYQLSGLQWLLRSSRLLEVVGLARLESELPPIRPVRRWHTLYPARHGRKGRVALFTGCVTNLVDQDTLESAIRLLTHFGYEVQVPANQVCCGALHQHDGETVKADALMHQNIVAFEVDNVDAIISTASGCGAMLAEYGRIHSQKSAARHFSSKVMDINQFLAKKPWPNEISLVPLKKRIALHDPCSLVHVLHQQQPPYMLLKKIPEVEIVPLVENHICCGAAGSYHLTQADMASRLRADKIAHLEHIAPDILATSNVGCALFLAAGIKEAGLKTEVVHPIALLARQMQNVPKKA